MPSQKTSKRSSPKKSSKSSGTPQKTSLSQRVKAVAGKLTTGQKAAIGAAVLAAIGTGVGFGAYKYNKHRQEMMKPSQPFFNSTNTKEAWAHEMFKKY